MAYSSSKPPTQQKARSLRGFLDDLDKAEPMSREEWSSIESTYRKQFDEPYIKKISEISDIRTQTGVETAQELKAKTFDQMHVPTQTYSTILTTLKHWNYNKKGMYIYGKVGMGKTYLMKAFRHDLFQRGLLNKKKFEFFNMVNLTTMLKDFETKRIDRGYETKTSDFAMNKCLNADILVIDDFGAGREKPTEFEVESIFKILDHRSECYIPKPTFMTSNLEPRHVKEKFGMRIADRIVQLMVLRELNNGSGQSYRWASPQQSKTR